MAEHRQGVLGPCAASPLEGSVLQRCFTGLIERTGLGALNLRGSGEAFLAAASRALGTSLPAEPNTTVNRGDLLALWLGPDEWLLRMPADQVEARASALRAALDDRRVAVVDVSDRAATLRLSGVQAREVLAQGCPLDLHPRAFRPGACAQSRFRKAAILINQVDDIPTYDLQTPRSYVEYLWDILIEASREFD